MKGCILLAACGSNEVLPSNAQFPADLFTSCLTTPVKTALRWFCSSNPLLKGLKLDMADQIPGKLNDRRTPLGEINWIFTAITDTIAWNVLPPPLFQKLYRQDLLVASLFRNYLLADRIFRSVGCTPSSYPKLPPTHMHPMWDSWDLTVESFLFHLASTSIPHEPLPPTETPNEAATSAAGPNPAASSRAASATITGTGTAPEQSSSSSSSSSSSTALTTTTPFPNSFFYSDQLTAFEVWLEFASENQKPPEQLPIVLQVLLSQAHRHRALYLLARFLDLGAWATNLALSVGIFPYVLKLLQSPAQDLRLILVFIWAKILALDRSCQTDLVKDQEPPYFLTVFNSKSSTEVRTMAAFVLSAIMDQHPKGQQICLKSGLLTDCLTHLNDPDPLLRRWVILCLGKLWEDNEEARWAGVRESAHERLCGLLTDPVPEVRAAVVFALGTFIQTDHTKLHPRTMYHDGESSEEGGFHSSSSTSHSERSSLDSMGSERRGSTDSPLSISPASSSPGLQGRRRGNSGMELRINIEMNLGVTLPVVTEDASPMVRKELVCALSRLVDSYSDRFREVAFDLWQESQMEAASGKARQSQSPDELMAHTGSSSALAGSPSAGAYRTQQSSVYACLWKVVLSLKHDPVPEVAVLADTIVRKVHRALALSTPYKPSASPLLKPESGMPIGIAGLTDSSEPDLPAESPPPERTSRLTSLLRASGRSEMRTPRRKTPNITSSSAALPDGAASEVVNLEDVQKEDEDVSLALPSHFYEWSCEYFSQPLNLFVDAKPTSSLAAGLPDDGATPYSTDSLGIFAAGGGGAGSSAALASSLETTAEQLSRPTSFEELDVSSAEYALLVRRHRRNNRVITEAFSIGQSTKNAPPRVDYPVAILDNATSISRKLIFHPFEPVLISANEQNHIGVWNWEEGQNFNTFSNQNSPGTRITALSLLNEQYDALLATGSNEGTIRIWKDFTGDTSPKLVTAWRAINDLFPTTRGSGLVFDWNNNDGLLSVSGDINVIRLWDVERELCTMDIQTACDSCVTCISSDRMSSHSLLTGFGNGKFRTFDTRAPNRLAPAGIVFPEFDTWVVNAQTLSSEHQVVAGSTSGLIKIFDLRQTGCALVQSFDRKEKISSLVAHQYAPVIATGSVSQRITFFNFKGEELSQVKYHEGFLGQRIGPISCLAFHPYLLFLAAGATDHIISVYTQPT